MKTPIKTIGLPEPTGPKPIWQFTIEKARVKLKRLYPKIKT